MRALAPVRRAVETNLTDIVSGRFQSQVMNLRELITRDTLYSLTTVNDSRVLLNVYTVLLLIVLGYFGIRLQVSYRALNLSHVDLAIANTSLEARVKERTRDLESAYDELKESQVQLVQAEKMSSLGQLVAGIVHEINTPLLYVLNNATVTAENVEELRECTTNATRLVEAIDQGGVQAPEAREALRRLTDCVDPAALNETIDEIVALAQRQHRRSETDQRTGAEPEGLQPPRSRGGRPLRHPRRHREDAADHAQPVEVRRDARTAARRCAADPVRAVADQPGVHQSGDERRARDGRQGHADDYDQGAQRVGRHRGARHRLRHSAGEHRQDHGSVLHDETGRPGHRTRIVDRQQNREGTRWTHRHRFEGRRRYRDHDQSAGRPRHQRADAGADTKPDAEAA